MNDCRSTLGMKLLLSGMFFVIVSATDITSMEWKRYKENYSKVYTTSYEDTQRLTQYLKTKQMIEEHNEKFRKGETGYAVGINQFADWFPKELNKLTSLKVDESRKRGEVFKLAPGTTVENSVNWVAKGAVTEVKNQGTCGSCYAFSSAGALEGLMFVKNKTITDLSSQELVDCSPNYGCEGGTMIACFSYVAKQNGIATEESYPYKGRKGLCRAEEKQIGASCTGWKEIQQNENDLRNAVGTEGPVSIGFAVSAMFMFYKHGIYDGPCAWRINHAMLVVGYDLDEPSGEEFWLIKNSWGSTWGEKGYAKVIKGRNICDIAELGSFPTYS